MDGNLNAKLKAMLMLYLVFKYVSTDYTPMIFKPKLKSNQSKATWCGQRPLNMAKGHLSWMVISMSS